MTGPQWTDAVEWWLDPRLSYRAGYDDGYAAGWREAYARYDVELAGAIHRALSGHERAVQARDRRRAADQAAPRPGDWPGVHNMTTDQRRRVYARLLATWDTETAREAA